MKEKAKYTEAFRKQALEKVYNCGRRSVKAVAEELNMNLCVANSYSCGNGCLKKSIAVRYPGIVVEFCA